MHVLLDMDISDCAVSQRQGSAAGFQARLVPVRTSQLSSEIRLVSVLLRSRRFPAMEEHSFLGEKHNTIQYKLSHTGLKTGLAHPLKGERLVDLKLLLSCMPKPMPSLTRRQSNVLNSSITGSPNMGGTQVPDRDSPMSFRQPTGIPMSRGIDSPGID